MAIASISCKGHCLPFEICMPFKSYEASNLTAGEKRQQFNIFGLTGGAHTENDPDRYIFDKSLSIPNIRLAGCMQLSSTVSEIQRDIGRKSGKSCQKYTPPVFNAPDKGDPLECRKNVYLRENYNGGATMCAKG